MKQFTFIILLVCALFSHAAIAQNIPDYSQVSFQQKSDYKLAEPTVLQATRYVLSTPFDKNDIDRLTSIQFVLKWMEGTPDFNFTFGSFAAKISKENENWLGCYLAALAQQAIENPTDAKDEKIGQLRAVKLLLAYGENPNNQLPLTKYMKKLAKANRDGNLEKEIN